MCKFCTFRLKLFAGSPLWVGAHDQVQTPSLERPGSAEGRAGLFGPQRPVQAPDTRPEEVWNLITARARASRGRRHVGRLVCEART